MMLTTFEGGTTGIWRVKHLQAVSGTPLPAATHVAMREERPTGATASIVWSLRGVTSYERYVHRVEKNQLVAQQPTLGRPEATRAALIPIKKSDAWWDLSQDERRMIFEEKSHHIAEGLKYLPAVARRLYHCRELGEPFDFLTWFEYAPTDSDTFEELVQTLRQTEEWKYVIKEIDIRLVRDV
jgi:chlorite dismutase